jgi:hypothetical protein
MSQTRDDVLWPGAGWLVRNLVNFFLFFLILPNPESRDERCIYLARSLSIAVLICVLLSSRGVVYGTLANGVKHPEEAAVFLAPGLQMAPENRTPGEQVRHAVSRDKWRTRRVQTWQAVGCRPSVSGQDLQRRRRGSRRERSADVRGKDKRPGWADDKPQGSRDGAHLQVRGRKGLCHRAGAPAGGCSATIMYIHRRSAPPSQAVVQTTGEDVMR